MAAPKTVLVGDRVRYESAAGVIRGEVIDIKDGTCADGIARPWIYVKYIRNNRECVSRLANESLAMMKFKVIFRDIDVQIARGEKVAA